jgi:ankyrin repeat protein
MDYDYDILLEPERQLIIAIDARLPALIKSIVHETGADPNVILPPLRHRPIHIASHGSTSSVLAALEDVGANLYAVNKWKQTAIFSAIHGKNLDAIDFLARRDADLNTVDDMTISPLEYAEMGRDVDVIAKLRFYGAYYKPDRSDQLLFLPQPPKIITEPETASAEDPLSTPGSLLRWIAQRKNPQGPDNSPPRPGD